MIVLLLILVCKENGISTTVTGNEAEFRFLHITHLKKKHELSVSTFLPWIKTRVFAPAFPRILVEHFCNFSRKASNLLRGDSVNQLYFFKRCLKWYQFFIYIFPCIFGVIWISLCVPGAICLSSQTYSKAITLQGSCFSRQITFCTGKLFSTFFSPCGEPR